MKSLFLFIQKYQNLLLFLALQLIVFVLLVNQNSYQGAKFNTWSLSLMGDVHAKQREVHDYFSLNKTNEELAYQNAVLQELLINGRSQELPSFLSVQSPLGDRDLRVVPAKVVNATVGLQHNLITLNVGALDGIAVDMAVIGPLGVVGVIKSVTEHYALVLPLVNMENRVSSKLLKNNYFGSLRWDTHNYKYASLGGIENHVPVSIGDTLVTSGFGAVYPEGVMLGTISEIKPGVEGVFHDIEVELSTDFNRLSYVYVVHNETVSERLQLEESSLNN